MTIIIIFELQYISFCKYNVCIYFEFQIVTFNCILSEYLENYLGIQ